METGPVIMYVQETKAFADRAKLIGTARNSTPSSPPINTNVDIDGLCKLKQKVINNLPLQCGHCGINYLEKTSFAEFMDGTIMAYCKGPGCCGRSMVLFAGVELWTPTYTQICPFIPFQDEVEEATSPRSPESPSTNSSTSPRSVNIENIIAYQQWSPSVRNPDSVCEICSKPFGLHDSYRMTQCDSYGWIANGKRELLTPADWPEYYAPECQDEGSSRGSGSTDGEHDHPFGGRKEVGGVEGEGVSSKTCTVS